MSKIGAFSNSNSRRNPVIMSYLSAEIEASTLAQRGTQAKITHKFIQIQVANNKKLKEIQKSWRSR